MYQSNNVFTDIEQLSGLGVEVLLVEGQRVVYVNGNEPDARDMYVVLSAAIAMPLIMSHVDEQLEAALIELGLWKTGDAVTAAGREFVREYQQEANGG